MKILKNLVWDKNSGELIGFVDLSYINVKFATSMSWYFWLKLLSTHYRRALLHLPPQMELQLFK